MAVRSVQSDFVPYRHPQWHATVVPRFAYPARKCLKKQTPNGKEKGPKVWENKPWICSLKLRYCVKHVSRTPLSLSFSLCLLDRFSAIQGTFCIPRFSTHLMQSTACAFKCWGPPTRTSLGWLLLACRLGIPKTRAGNIKHKSDTRNKRSQREPNNHIAKQTDRETIKTYTEVSKQNKTSKTNNQTREQSKSEANQNKRSQRKRNSHTAKQARGSDVLVGHPRPNAETF